MLLESGLPPLPASERLAHSSSSISDPPPNRDMLSPPLPLSLLPPPGLPPPPRLPPSSNLYPHLFPWSSLTLTNPQNHNKKPKRNSETYSRIAFLELSANNLFLLLLSHRSWHYWAPGTRTVLQGPPHLHSYLPTRQELLAPFYRVQGPTNRKWQSPFLETV